MNKLNTLLVKLKLMVFIITINSKLIKKLNYVKKYFDVRMYSAGVVLEKV